MSANQRIWQGLIDNQSSALDLATCAKTSPFIGQSMSSSVSCPSAALWCLIVLMPEAQCLRDFSLFPLPPPPPFYSLSNVPVYRWDVDDVDKRILHSLGFFWSWFVTVTVTVWKNKIRVRHASLGELRLKHSVSWITIKTDMLAVFHWDTNQVKSSKRLSNKERQITAWREKKKPVVLGRKNDYLFF